MQTSCPQVSEVFLQRRLGASVFRCYCRDGGETRERKGGRGGEGGRNGAGEALREGRESQGNEEEALEELSCLRTPLPLILRDLGKPTSHSHPPGSRALGGDRNNGASEWGTWPREHDLGVLRCRGHLHLARDGG